MKWNFKLTMFELTMYFKHEIIRMWQRFYKKIELSGTFDLNMFDLSMPSLYYGFRIKRESLSKDALLY